MGSRKRLNSLKNSTPNPFRNLEKANLGGVIFGCTDKTLNECFSKQLFGLPAQHFGYVKNIDPGLPLFLFNYSRRALHGVYEAASPGQMNINPYGWTRDGSERTSYPAQVLIRTLKNCRPLLENQFSPIIQGNYYSQMHFRFELDHAQADRLIALFSTQVVAPSTPVTRSTGNLAALNRRPSRLENGQSHGIVPSDALLSSTAYNKPNEHLTLTGPSECYVEMLGKDDVEANGKDEMELIYEKFHELDVNSEPTDSVPVTQAPKSSNTDTLHFEAGGLLENHIADEDSVKDSSVLPSDYPSIIAQLMLENQELKVFKQESIVKFQQLEQRLSQLELEVQLPQGHDGMMLLSSPGTHGLTAESCSDQQLDLGESIFLSGGYDGNSWLGSLESYFPSKDLIKSLCPMSSLRSYASLARLNDDIYVIGGGGPGGMWCDTVECYSALNNDWTSLACLNEKKGSLAAVSLHDKIFALGGGNGVKSFSDVEMFDLDVGRWISARSMLQKRFSLSAVELNGVLYAVGGFDGKDYLSSAERFDLREHSWSRLESMKSKRGCHAMVVLNEKLYAIGGFDGNSMVNSVEVFDPRVGRWTDDVSMNYQRGYSVAAVVNNNIYAIGGLGEDQQLVEKIERYEQGCGWQVTDLKGVGKRCFASAIV